MKNLVQKSRKSIIRVLGFIMLVIFLQVIGTYFTLKEILVNEDKVFIQDMTKIVKNDIKYENNKWDTTLYNSNPLTPYPNASSTFPLYIITSDGFVIERSKPINGYLDTSDMKLLLRFQKPETLNTLTNENWRIISKPFVVNGSTVGVIVVSYYNPENQILTSIDKRLNDNLQKIESSVKWENDKLTLENFDIRNIDYTVSFEVVDKYNKLVINNGRVPAFIDPSYVNQEFNIDSYRRIADSKTNEEFLIKSETLLDTSGNKIGIIVVGKSHAPINRTLKDYTGISLVVSGLFITPLLVLGSYGLNQELKKNYESFLNKGKQKLPKKISFDPKTGILLIDNKTIKIPYDTNQFYMCKVLFHTPNKKWEQDELLEKFGQTFEKSGSRKVYDTMTALNHKAEIKLIVYENKRFSINPNLLNSII